MKTKFFFFSFFIVAFMALMSSHVSATASFFPPINYTLGNPFIVPFEFEESFSIWKYARNADNQSTYLTFQNPDTGSAVTLFGGHSHHNSFFDVTLSTGGLISIGGNSPTSALPMSVTIGNNFTSEASNTFYFRVVNTYSPSVVSTFSNLTLGSYGGSFSFDAGSYFDNFNRISISYSDTVLSQTVFMDRYLGQPVRSSNGSVYVLMGATSTTVFATITSNGYDYQQTFNVTAYNSYGQVSQMFRVNTSSFTSPQTEIYHGATWFENVLSSVDYDAFGIVPLVNVSLSKIYQDSRSHAPVYCVFADPHVLVGCASVVSHVATFSSPLNLTAGQGYHVTFHNLINGTVNSSSVNFSVMSAVSPSYSANTLVLYSYQTMFDGSQYTYFDAIGLSLSNSTFVSSGNAPTQIFSLAPISMGANQNTTVFFDNLFSNYDTITVTDPVSNTNIFYSITQSGFPFSSDNQFFTMSVLQNGLLSLSLYIQSKSTSFHGSLVVVASNANGSTSLVPPIDLMIDASATGGGGGSSPSTSSLTSFLLSIYPSAEGLTLAQRVAYIISTMLVITLAIMLGMSTFTGAVPKLAIYLAIFFDALFFIYFVSIQYISVVLLLEIIAVILMIWYFLLKGK